jgi:hypothetical protein
VSQTEILPDARGSLNLPDPSPSAAAGEPYRVLMASKED